MDLTKQYTQNWILKLKPYCPFFPFTSSFTALQLSIYLPSEAGNGEGTVPYTVYIIHYIELCIQYTFDKYDWLTSNGWLVREMVIKLRIIN